MEWGANSRSGAEIIVQCTIKMFCTATAVRGVEDEGFQIMVSPQAAAIMAKARRTANHNTLRLRHNRFKVLPPWYSV